MSADLDFRQDLTRIQAPSDEIPALQQPCSSADDQIGLVIQGNGGESNECRTPTSKEHKIPPVLSCPPAPRKPRRTPSCKRKLSELEFIKIVNHEEVDSFFRSSFDAPAKRRCPCK
ncbi:cyclin-dependent protein kinase inhibitor SMR1-like [Ricinus communis]|uniref:cyclin-dependent protein kinase inhibitor SMR1-like n=1 Tax=Ricinus communis TaxID=3988 RepID=UPI00201A2C75|nr:cyclin-dependent protein kinase inhibitor SMR1-like [Ricinus communis]